MENWIANFQADVKTICENKVEEWSKIVKTFGLSNEQKAQWIKIFKENITQTFADMIQDVEDKQIQVINEIEELLKKISDLCNILQQPIPAFGEKQHNLYVERGILRKSLEEFESKINERRLKLNALRQKEIELCTSLGNEHKPYHEEELLLKDNMSQYAKYIEELELLKFTRTETYLKIRSSIVDLINEIQYKPCGQFEMTVYGNEDALLLTEEDMNKLENFHQHLIAAKTNLQEAVTDIREQIQELAAIVDEDIQETNQFLAQHNYYTYECLDSLKAKLERLHEIKLCNIESFIQKLRIEIKEWWQKCYYTDKQQEEFHYMMNDCFTEELLSLHDLELKKLKKYYADNRDIFTLLAKREELWAKLRSLENCQKADRFKNRAGQLLQEEKERNKISTMLPKVEAQLCDLAAAYETENGRPFRVRGRLIQEIIDETHEQRNNEKKLKAAKRKHEGLTPSPRNQRQKLSIYNPQSGASSAVKNGSTAKKLKMSKNVQTAPSKLHFSVNKRLSEERVKRIHSARRALKENRRKSKRHELGVEIVEDESYNDFQENISDGCRSTMCMIERSPLAAPLPATPSTSTVPRKLTPGRVGLKSPNSKSKLTASSLKLLF